MKFFFISLLFTCASLGNLKAQDYFLNAGDETCAIQSFKNGELETVSSSNFFNIPLKATQLKLNPEFREFTVAGQVYIVQKDCLKLHVRTAKAPIAKPVVNSRLFTVDKYYIEFEGGINKIADRAQVPSDYNLLFPSSNPAVPVVWGSSVKSDYLAKNLFHLGFGMRANEKSYYALKLRIFQGTKNEVVSLTAVNTGGVQTWNWTYNDLFINTYVGYKIFFTPRPYWKFMVGGYLGLSSYNSDLSDGISVIRLTSSLTPAFLADAEAEYRFESKTAIGFNLGYEYLGTKSISAPTASNVKTNISYSNSYGTLAIKYYFN
jgi:hypothetical protein